MEQGPNCAVAVALVVIAYLLRGQKQRVEIHGLKLSGHGIALIGIVYFHARPAYPVLFAVDVHGIYAGCKAAFAALEDEIPFYLCDFDRKSVCDYIQFHFAFLRVFYIRKKYKHFL